MVEEKSTAGGPEESVTGRGWKRSKGSYPDTAQGWGRIRGRKGLRGKTSSNGIVLVLGQHWLSGIRIRKVPIELVLLDAWT